MRRLTTAIRDDQAGRVKVNCRMLRFDDLALRRGPLLLFEHVDLALHAGWRVGVSGRNGAGKSSLLAPDRRRTGARCRPFRASARLDHGLRAPGSRGPGYQRARLRARRRHRIAPDRTRPGRWPKRRTSGARIAALHERLHAIDGYAARARAGELLHGLGFTSGRRNARRCANSPAAGACA